MSDGWEEVEGEPLNGVDVSVAIEEAVEEGGSTVAEVVTKDVMEGVDTVDNDMVLLIDDVPVVMAVKVPLRGENVPWRELVDKGARGDPEVEGEG